MKQWLTLRRTDFRRLMEVSPEGQLKGLISAVQEHLESLKLHGLVSAKQHFDRHDALYNDTFPAYRRKPASTRPAGLSGTKSLRKVV